MVIVVAFYGDRLSCTKGVLLKINRKHCVFAAPQALKVGLLASSNALQESKDTSQ